MTEKDAGVVRVEGCSTAENFRGLADLNVRHYVDRRAYEWKINFGLWAAIALLTGFMLSNRSSLPSHVGWILGGLHLGIFAFFAFIQVPSIQAANEEDKDWIHYYKARAEGLPGDRPSGGSVFKRRYRESTLGNRTWWYTVGFTMLLLLFSLLVIVLPTPARS